MNLLENAVEKVDLFSSFINNEQKQYDIKRTVKLIYNGNKIEKTLCFKEVDYYIAKEMIVKNHYSHKWNSSFGKINVGVFENDVLLGVASFGSLMNPGSFTKLNKDFTKDSVIELNRLWVSDELGGNTETVLLKASFDIIKKKYSKIKVVQSFADGRLGCGTIYKAMSFKYYGFSETLFYEDTITKEVYHNVPLTNTMRPDGMIKLNHKLIRNELKAFTVKTYRYIYSLYKNVSIDISEQSYPSYEKGITIVDIDINANCVFRAYVLSELLDYSQSSDLKNWIYKNINLINVDEQLDNESILRIAEQRNKVTKLNEIRCLFKSTQQ